MRIVFATDLSDANEAAIESRTCLECLDNIGVGEVHRQGIQPLLDGSLAGACRIGAGARIDHGMNSSVSAYCISIQYCIYSQPLMFGPAIGKTSWTH